MTWRDVTDMAKSTPLTLRIADFLGRGKGGLRFIDRLPSPAPAPRTPNLARWYTQELAAVWIGHATVLLRIGDMTILTDPVMSNRVGIGLGLITGGPRRQQLPALSIRDLPPLDLILVSHAHFDHLDRPTLNRLDKRTPVITSEHNSDLIRDLGFTQVSEMRWGESMNVGSVKLTSQKVRHWGARTFHDTHRSFTGFLIEGGRRRAFFAGDSAYCDYLKDLGRVDLAIFGIGGYDPYIQAHANPEQVWEMSDHVRADYLLPVHHSTFRLSREPMDQPIGRLLDVARGRLDRIVGVEVGMQWSI